MNSGEESGKWDRGAGDQRRGLRYLQLPLKEIQCCVNQTDNLQQPMEINTVKYLEDCCTKMCHNILCMYLYVFVCVYAKMKLTDSSSVGYSYFLSQFGLYSRLHPVFFPVMEEEFVLSPKICNVIPMYSSIKCEMEKIENVARTVLYDLSQDNRAFTAPELTIM